MRDKHTKNYIHLQTYIEQFIKRMFRVHSSEEAKLIYLFSDSARVSMTESPQYLPKGLPGVIRCHIKADPAVQFVTWFKDLRVISEGADGTKVLRNGSLLIKNVIAVRLNGLLIKGAFLNTVLYNYKPVVPIMSPTERFAKTVSLLSYHLSIIPKMKNYFIHFGHKFYLFQALF